MLSGMQSVFDFSKRCLRDPKENIRVNYKHTVRTK